MRLLTEAGLRIGAVNAMGGKAGVMSLGRKPAEQIEVSAKR